MTGEAGDFAMTIEIFLIDDNHHLHHLAGDWLGLLVVLVERAFHVAEIALHAERGSYKLHGGDELVGGNPFQDLDVLENLLGGFGR